ncbi:MAG: leucine-rich repeat protein, partial [Ruminococcus sp.]|nr:leucine-rich repeat protein [Ruminococcus sp.]
MKKQCIRIVSVLLTVLMLSAVMITPLSVSAASTDKSRTSAALDGEDTGTDFVDVSSYKGAVSDFSYEVYGTYEDRVKITGYKGTGGKIIIPSEIEDKPVMSIDKGAFKNKTSISAVLIPASVTSIGEEAFKGCTNLVEADIPVSVNYIRSEAFANCSSKLTFYTQASSQAKFYASKNGYAYDEKTPTFYYRETSSKKLEIVSYIGVPYGTARYLYLPYEVNDKTFTEIGPYAFAANPCIKGIDIDKNITTISDNAFKGCLALESAVIPSSVTTIEGQPFDGGSGNLRLIVKNPSKAYDWAVSNRINYVEDNTDTSNPDDFKFSEPDKYGQVSITKYTGKDENVVIPSRYEGYAVTEIGYCAFNLSKTVKSVTIPKSVTSIGEYAFAYCQNLNKIEIPETVGKIGKFAFSACVGLKSINLPISVYSIDDYAFYNCTSLESITLPDNNLTAINGYVFDGCSKLKSITIPDTVETIGPLAFAHCTSLSNVQFSSKLKKIGSGAFANCTALTGVWLPYSLQELGHGAFENCSKLSGNVVLHANVSKIDDMAFYKCSSLSGVYILNKNAVISPYRELFGYNNSNFKIYGYTSSTAEAYAGTHKMWFVALNQDENATSNYYYKNGNSTNRTYVSSITDAWNNVKKSGGVVGILADTKISSTLVVPAGTSVIFELNGHKLDRGLINSNKSNASGSVFKVQEKAKLTVYGGREDNPKPSGSVTASVWWPNGTKQDYTVENRGIITGGYTNANGGGINVEQYGVVELRNVAVVGNRAEGDAGDDNSEYGFGGGVCLYGNECKLKLDNSEISCNYARKGGGVAVIRGTEKFVHSRYKKYEVDTETFDYGDLGTVTYNYKDGYNYYCYDVDNSTIVGDGRGELGECPSTMSWNYAVVSGGGAYFDNDYCILRGMQLDNNYSNDNGGGLFTEGHECLFTDCVVTENNSKKYGGGVYNGSNTKGEFYYPYGVYNTYENVEITLNVSSSYGDGVFNAYGIDIGLKGQCCIYGNGENPKQQNLYMTKAHKSTLKDYRDTGYIVDKLSGNSSICVTYAKDRTGEGKRLTAYKSYHWEDFNLNYYDLDGNVFAHFVKEVSEDGYGLYITWTIGEKPQPVPVMKFDTRKAVDVAGHTYNSQPVKMGIFSYPVSGRDNDAVFYYSDGYFMESAQKYNDHLATLSTCMAHAAMNSKAGSTGDDGNYVFKGKNIHQMMIDMGCKKSDIFLSDTYQTRPTKDSIAYCIARKKLSNNDDLIIIAVRGGGYESEWASNVTIGESGEHDGFSNAAGQVFSGLRNFLERKGLDGSASTTKFWVAGYSRAGATSNLTAKRIVDKFDNNGTRTFGYPIEAPKGGVESAKKSGCNYNCIHNVVNYCDIVPWVAMGKMGFIRYGVDHFLPGTNVANKYNEGVPHDNYPELDIMVKDDNEENLYHNAYLSQKSKMLTQLKYINPDAVYDDYFDTATIEIIEGAVLGTKDVISTKSAKYKSVYDWIPAFFDHFVDWTFGCDGDNARKKYTERQFYKTLSTIGEGRGTAPIGYRENGHGSKSFQESLRSFIQLFMASSQSDDFVNALKDIDVMEDIGIPTLIEIYTSYLNDIPIISNFTELSYDELFERLWPLIKGKLAKKGFSNKQLEDFDGYFYTSLKFILSYASGDYKKNNMDDIGTVIYNAGKLIQNHDTDLGVPLAWVRSYDSYYTETGIQAQVEYTGNNHPQPPAVEVKSYTTGEIKRYTDPSAAIDVSLFDRIRFVPQDSSYSEEEGDIYYYRYVGEDEPENNTNATTEDYNWQVFNDCIVFDNSKYQDSDSVTISVFALRDQKLSNGDYLSWYKTVYKTLTPKSTLVKTYKFNISDKRVIAYTGKYNTKTKKYEYTKCLVSKNSVRTIKGAKPGVETDGDRWKFDHWVVYCYDPESGDVSDDPVNPSDYARLFGSDFNPKSETTTVKCLDEDRDYLFQSIYKSLDSCALMIPESAIDRASFVSALSKGKVGFSTSSESDSSLYNFESKKIAYDAENPVSISIETVKPAEYIEDGYMWSFKCWRVYPYNTLTKTVDRAHPISSDQYDELLGKDFKPEAKKTTVTNLTNTSLQFEPIYEASPVKYTSSIALPKSYDNIGKHYNYTSVAIPYVENVPSFITINSIKPCDEKDADSYKFDHWNVYPYNAQTDTADKQNPVSEKYFANYFGSAFDFESEKTDVYNFTEKDYLFEPVYKAEVTNGNFTYTIANAGGNDEYAKIKSYSGSGKDVTIPYACMRPSGKYLWLVKGIEDNAFEGNKTITNVELNENVTSIGSGAFKDCTKLTDITITDSITSIGADAFNGCTGLTRINIPESVTKIGAGAFANCRSNLTIYGKNSSYARTYANANGINFIDPSSDFQYSVENNKAAITGYVTPKSFNGSLVIPSTIDGYTVTAISANAFKDKNDITSVTIPASVTSIGSGAFSGCVGFTRLITDGNHGMSTAALANLPLSQIKELTITGSSIKADAFKGFTALTKVTIPDKVTSIGNNAFMDCAKLASATIPASVTSIGTQAFANCKSDFVIYGKTGSAAETFAKDNDIIFIDSDSNNQYYENLTFSVQGKKVTITGCTKATANLNIPAFIGDYPVTAIGNFAFEYDTNIVNVTIPDGVEKIGYAAFHGCKKLNSILLPDSVATIDKKAFENCTDLTDFTLPESLTAVSDEVFSGCTGLENIAIPKNVTNIGDKAFMNCSSLKRVKIGSAVTSIGAKAFYGSNISSLEIPDSVTSIGDESFRYCSNLKYTTIGTGVTVIGKNAFRNCLRLTSAYIPNTVTEIGNNAFSDCDKLKIYGDASSAAKTYANNNNIKFVCDNSGYSAVKTFTQSGTVVKAELTGYNGADKVLNIPSRIGGPVTAIKADAFKDNKGITNVTIPETVTNIGAGAFSGCTSLKSVVIPETVTAIEDGAFLNCGSGLALFGSKPSAAYSYASSNNLRFFDIDEYQYSVVCGEATIKGYLGSAETLVIPSTIGSARVTAISANAFRDNTVIKSAIIPDSVISIGNQAFLGCTALTNVSFGKNTDIIGTGAFNGCTSLESVEIIDGVTSINAYAFASCSKLANATIYDSVTDIETNAFANCKTGFAIYGEDGSAAQTYADSNNINFVSLSSGSLFSEGITFTVSDDKATITGFEEPEDFNGQLFIPKTLGGYTVTAIGQSAFRNKTGIKSLYIPDGIVSIGKQAFRGCTSIDSVIFPDSVTTIGESAFAECTSLTQAYLKKVKTIGAFAFDGCESLISANIPDSVTSLGEGAFRCCGFYTIKVGAEVSAIPNDAFRACEKMTSIVISGNIKSVGEGAFYACEELRRIELPDGVTSIGDQAFYLCKNLKSVTIPATVTAIADNAFEGCWSAAFKICGYGGSTAMVYANNHEIDFVDIDCTDFEYTSTGTSTTITKYTGSNEEVIIPSSLGGAPVTKIDSEEFYYNSDLKKSVFGSSVTSVTIPDSVTSIGACAFFKCSNLTSVKLSSNLTSIGDKAFYYCSELTDIAIPDSVTSIGDNAFENCSAATSLKLGKSLTNIGANAFCNCSGATDLIIPDGVTTIGDSAFSGCSGFTALIIPDSVTSVGNKAFQSCTGLTSVDIPDSVTSIGNYAFDSCTKLTNVDIPDSITSISNGVFRNCSGLTSVKLSKNLTSIGSYSFYKTGINKIIIPDGVTSIDSYALRDCSNLYGIVIPSSVTEIDKYALKKGNTFTIYADNSSVAKTVAEQNNNIFIDVNNCEWTFSEPVNGTVTVTGYTGSATSLTIPSCDVYGNIVTCADGTLANHTDVTSVAIPRSINTIKNTFKGCTSLESVDIPLGLENIGESAFEGCTGLTSLTFEGNRYGLVGVSDDISIAYNAFKGCTGLTSVEFPRGLHSVGESAFEGCTGITSIRFNTKTKNGDLKIGKKAFKGCTGLENLIFHDTSNHIGFGIESIGESAFEGCTGLTSLDLPYKDLKVIGDSAFKDCTGLTSIDYSGYDTESIGDYAFAGCTGLKDVNISCSCGNQFDYDDNTPEHGLKSIGTGAFKDCTALTSVRITPSELFNSYSDYLFAGCTSLNSLNIPNFDIVSIGNYIFKDCSSLVTAPKFYDLESIGDGAYANCSALTNVYYSKKLESIGAGAFEGCSSIASINIPDNVTYIGSQAFDGCKQLTEISIPGNVSSLSSFVFSDCSNLEKVTIGDGIKEIGDGAFYDCNKLSEINIPASVETIAETAFEGCVSLDSLTIDGDYQLDNRSSDVLKKSGVQNLTITGSSIKDEAFNGFNELKNVEISDTVESIGNKAFKDCSKLSKANIPNSVGSIGNNAFNNSGITDIEIPEGVKTINQGAFQNCSELKSVTLPDSVSSIGLSAFKDCSELSDLTIGDSTITVNSNAFDNCSDVNILTSGEGKGTMRTSSGSLFNTDSSASFHISDGNFSEDVSAYIDNNKLIGINSVSGVNTYTVYDPTTEDLTLESDSHKFILPEGKNTILERMDLVGVQLRNRSINQKEALRFITAVRTDLL